MCRIVFRGEKNRMTLWTRMDRKEADTGNRDSGKGACSRAWFALNLCLFFIFRGLDRKAWGMTNTVHILAKFRNFLAKKAPAISRCLEEKTPKACVKNREMKELRGKKTANGHRLTRTFNRKG